MEDKKIAAWLNAKFIEWERIQGQRGTVREFAEWLGISEKTLGNWMNGHREPKGSNVDLVAAKLGPEIYDLLGLARPDPILGTFKDRMDGLHPSVRERLSALAASGASAFEVMLQTFIEFLKDESTGFAPLAEGTQPTITIDDIKKRSLTELIEWALKLPLNERRQLVRLALDIIAERES